MLLECVPNISEGKDTAIIESIVAAIKTAQVIDVHSDPDHNRSVITLAGEQKGLEQAALDLTERAVQLLDIHEHQGVHPFIGVVDVIPFIPLKGTKMVDAINSAHEVGKLLWQKYKLPVYYYGEAARIKERRDLPYVRKGGFEALRREINTPQRKPDEGQGLHATAGAVAVGARNFLIAFNINLKTQDLDIAKSIANNIREKHGGLAGVRALGLPLESRKLTQVSINITDHKETSLRKVFDEVRVWAREYGVEILDSELVGLIPKEALLPEMKDVLKLPNFSEKQVLENNL